MTKFLSILVLLAVLILLAGCIDDQAAPSEGSAAVSVTPHVVISKIVTRMPTTVPTTIPTTVPTPRPTKTPVPVTVRQTPAPTSVPVTTIVPETTVEVMKSVEVMTASAPADVKIVSGMISNRDVTAQLVSDLLPFYPNGNRYGNETPQYNPCGTSLYWDNTTYQAKSMVTVTKVYTNSTENQYCFGISDESSGAQLRADLTSQAVIVYTVNGVQKTVSVPALSQITL